MTRWLILLASLVWFSASAEAQDTATVVTTCGSPTYTLVPGRISSVTMDINGNFCTNAASGGGGGGGSVTQGTVPWVVSGTVTANQGGAPWSITAASLPLPTGAATSALQSTINTTLGSPFQAGGSIGNTSFGATQSGTWNINNISGTISLPTGAATSALQTTINTTLGSPFQAGGSIGNTVFGATQSGTWNVGITAGASGIGSVTQGTTPWIIGTYGGPMPVTLRGALGQPIGQDLAGSLLVDASQTIQPISAASLPLPNGAFPAGGLIGNTGFTETQGTNPWIVGASKPLPVTLRGALGQPIGQDLAGALLVDASQTIQPISASTLPLPTGAFPAGGSIGNTTFSVTQGTYPWVISTPQGLQSATRGPLGQILTTTLSGALLVDASKTIQPISATSLPLETGAFPAGGSIGNTSFGATQGTIPWVVSLTGALLPVGRGLGQVVATTLGGAVQTDGSQTIQPVVATAPQRSGTGWRGKILNALSTTVVSIKPDGGGQLAMLQCGNTNSSEEYVQLFDLAPGAVTLGTTTPVLSVPIAATATGGFALGQLGIQFGGPISAAATTTATGSSAPASALDCNAAFN